MDKRENRGEHRDLNKGDMHYYDRIINNKEALLKTNKMACVEVFEASIELVYRLAAARKRIAELEEENKEKQSQINHLARSLWNIDDDPCTQVTHHCANCEASAKRVEELEKRLVEFMQHHTEQHSREPEPRVYNLDLNSDKLY